MHCTTAWVTCQAGYTGYTMSSNHDHMAEPEQTDELFVAFANTLHHERGEAVDDVAEIESLLSWLRAHDLLSSRGLAAESGKLRRDPREAARRIARFRRLRDVLHGVAGDLSRQGSGPAQATCARSTISCGTGCTSISCGSARTAAPTPSHRWAIDSTRRARASPRRSPTSWRRRQGRDCASALMRDAGSCSWTTLPPGAAAGATCGPAEIRRRWRAIGRGSAARAGPAGVPATADAG